MAFCTQCGARLPDSARFCPRCGAAVAAVEAAPSTPAAREHVEEVVERAPARAPSRDLPPEGLHFGPDRTSTTTPRRDMRDVDATPDEDEQRGGTGTRLLVILALIAVAVLGVVFWQQRDGIRPVADTATNASEPADTPSTEPTGVAAVPTPEPTPTPTPSPDAEVAQTGDEIGSPASLDPNGEAAIPAAAIDAAFNDDPERAFAEFPGPVTVRGTVIGLLSDQPPAISLEGYRRGGIVVADLARGQDDAVGLLSRGSVVRLRCASVRRQAATTVLLGCRI
ncbi:zinc ribbon domain-containing protein [Sphingomonas sp. Mn802worker]|uniref:zinc ribbon domain-containing protein n=1 Tax=Sphingomonas sp. Mn802worker TaxID=629773 RepID=UPI00039F6970|nr:zinc ribbon domain-containing protein [Sphingomonas sp. Mn802worker]